MTELNFSSDKGYYPQNLTSIQDQMLRLYGNQTQQPSMLSLYERDLYNGNKSKDNIDLLPIKWAPSGNQFPSAGYTQTNEPLLSNKTYQPTAKTGLSLPMSIPQPDVFTYKITPQQLQQQLYETNKYISSKQYSRSIPQRSSSYDRGMS